jgi:hypothetical protein
MPGSGDKAWFIRAIWFCGIIFALFSVLTAAQQTLRLHRLSAHRDGLHYIRLCLVRERKTLDSEGGQAKLVPRAFQVYSWQSAMVFLLLAVTCLLVGMLVLVWSAVIKETGGLIWNGNAWVSELGSLQRERFTNLVQLAIIYTVVLMASIAFFLATQVSMMVGPAVGEQE